MQERHGQSELKIHHGLYCIRLVGNELERGRQHAHWLNRLKGTQPTPFTLKPLSQKNQNLILRALGSKLIGTVYETLVMRWMVKQLPAHTQELIRNIATIAQIEEKEAWLALYQPDMLMVLAATSNERTKNLFLEGLPACSTAIINRNEKHPFYFIRNLDYPAASVWEKWPAVFYHESTDSLSYTHVASLGIHPAALTGVNECGISFSLHAHFSKKISLKGHPVMFLGDQILQQARTLEDALRIIKKFPTIGSWALNIASFKENKSVSVEIAEGKMFVREQDSQGELAHTNFFHAKNLQPNELHFSGSVSEDLACRKKAIEKYLKSHREHFELKDALSVLAQHEDVETGETRVFGNTPSVVTTIQTVIFDPDHESLWVSNRNETPTTLGPYVKLPVTWNQGFEDLAPVPVGHHLSPAFLESLHHYHEAYVAWQVNHLDAHIAHEFLEKAIQSYPQDAHLFMQKGYFDLILGNYESARSTFEQALKRKLSAHHQNVSRYFLANCLDLLGDRAAALAAYQAVLNNANSSSSELNPKLKKKVLKRLKKPLKPRHCKKIMPDLQFPEPIEYS